jgi:hypothetical protein
METVTHAGPGLVGRSIRRTQMLSRGGYHSVAFALLSAGPCSVGCKRGCQLVVLFLGEKSFESQILLTILFPLVILALCGIPISNRARQRGHEE